MCLSVGIMNIFAMDYIYSNGWQANTLEYLSKIF